jgi:hypothetical protein
LSDICLTLRLCLFAAVSDHIANLIAAHEPGKVVLPGR